VIPCCSKGMQLSVVPILSVMQSWTKSIVYSCVMCSKSDMEDGIRELQQRLLDQEKELEMKEAMHKQVTREVRACSTLMPSPHV
jgi:hypothetical protein